MRIIYRHIINLANSFNPRISFQNASALVNLIQKREKKKHNHNTIVIALETGVNMLQCKNTHLCAID
jgi:hypothetical protein